MSTTFIGRGIGSCVSGRGSTSTIFSGRTLCITLRTQRITTLPLSSGLLVRIKPAALFVAKDTTEF